MNLRGLQSLHNKGTLLLLIGFCDESQRVAVFAL